MGIVTHDLCDAERLSFCCRRTCSLSSIPDETGQKGTGRTKGRERRGGCGYEQDKKAG
jgi:hypothetical protein